ncbi:uncharacterized protein N7458_008143 [Penicillium daleae]|uniref:PD-(D/E)XK nuclease-like domain-containing protein n=1 Tax=Penicillium daleae TaxID=63821 RepID=A0AAD6C2D0_9EURO|nr:uncharacterized protein N7458_008143 [Penicillium daleae]KAJ5444271.1 hypothetical protein N7458_008143 [Penicillium daleae]
MDLNDKAMPIELVTLLQKLDQWDQVVTVPRSYKDVIPKTIKPEIDVSASQAPFSDPPDEEVRPTAPSEPLGKFLADEWDEVVHRPLLSLVFQGVVIKWNVEHHRILAERVLQHTEKAQDLLQGATQDINLVVNDCANAKILSWYESDDKSLNHISFCISIDIKRDSRAIQQVRDNYIMESNFHLNITEHRSLRFNPIGIMVVMAKDQNSPKQLTTWLMPNGNILKTWLTMRLIIWKNCHSCLVSLFKATSGIVLPHLAIDVGKMSGMNDTWAIQLLAPKKTFWHGRVIGNTVTPARGYCPTGACPAAHRGLDQACLLALV